MIIGYDRNPNASVDQKVQSLMESVQMALNEVSGGTTTIIHQSSGGGGGGGGTTNYNDLYNKPQIEGVPLTGNKLFPDLNLNVLTNTEIHDLIENMNI